MSKYSSSTPSCLLTRRLVAQVYFRFVFKLLVNSEIIWIFRIRRSHESKLFWRINSIILVFCDLPSNPSFILLAVTHVTFKCTIRTNKIWMEFWGHWAWVNSLNHTHRDRSGGTNPTFFRFPQNMYQPIRNKENIFKQLLLTPCTFPLKILFCETAWHPVFLCRLLESRWWGTSLFSFCLLYYVLSHYSIITFKLP